MKKQYIRSFAVGGILLLTAASVLLPLCSLASIWEVPMQNRIRTAATPDYTATPGNLAPDEEDGNLLDDVSMLHTQESPYTICSYYFRYLDWPFQWPLGNAFDADEELDPTLIVYLDDPDGHINLEEDLVLPVEWDLSHVDFEKKGIYPVTGTIDTNVCEYLVDWDNAPSPKFMFEIVTGSVLSFAPNADGDSLILEYEMDRKPFLFELGGNMHLYESLDEGDSWHEITQSARVQITEESIVISDVTVDSLFQATGMNLGYYYPECSDIVAVKADQDSGIQDIRIIASGGMQGGVEWNEENGSDWSSGDLVIDGPYPILRYAVNRFMQSLTVPVSKGSTDPFQAGRYDNIWVYYGDRPDGYWSDYQVLDAEWDWSPLDTIDWNQAGDTVIHGTFTKESMEKADPRLDFDTMPKLTLTITVYEQRTPLTMRAKEKKLLANQTVTFGFYDESGYDHIMPISFDDDADVTVWCSVDGGNIWYDITSQPGVRLDGDTLSIAWLKDSVLRSSKGYQFQLQQNTLPDYEAFSSGVHISHDCFGLTFANAAIGGERGGGKRQDKPPEGLFDGPETVTPTVENPAETTASAEESSAETEAPSEENPAETESPSKAGPAETESPQKAGPAETELPQKADPAESESPSKAGPVESESPSKADPTKSTAPPEESAGKLTPPLPEEGFSMAGPSTAGSPMADSSAPDALFEPDAETDGWTPSPSSDMTQAAKATVLPTPSPSRDIMRTIASAAAILTGAVAGIFMIRRR